jgi:hypothetical protein
MNREGRNSRDPRRGLPSLAERQRTNFLVEPAKTERGLEREGPERLTNARHRFHMGQNVCMSLGAMQRGKSISCKIVKLLPFEGTHYQYRVKSTDEAFERIAEEHELWAMPGA